MKDCLFCGTPFTPKPNGGAHRYCSKTCNRLGNATAQQQYLFRLRILAGRFRPDTTASRSAAARRAWATRKRMTAARVSRETSAGPDGATHNTAAVRPPSARETQSVT